MKHLHFVQSLEPLEGGGLGAAALQLHEVLGRRGGSVLAATRGADFPLSWPGVYQGERSGPSALYYSGSLKKFAQSEVGGVDWIHGHGLYVYPNYVFGSEARRQSKPHACHIHGFFDPWILKRSRWKKALVSRLFENRNLRNARFLRALTEKEASQIRAVGLKNPVVVIPNGIDLATADEESNSKHSTDHFKRKRPKRVLFLSRLHPKKGLDMLIPVWAKLTREFPEWELVIVGPDEGGYQAVLEKLIKDSGTDDSCTIHPAVFGSLKHEVYRSADLFVLPSYSEGFPMAVLEALAHKLPVVLTTECNVPELAVENAAWECVPEAGPLENSLRQALSADDAERKQRGLLGRKIVESRYTWGSVADALEDACQKYQ